MSKQHMLRYPIHQRRWVQVASAAVAAGMLGSGAGHHYTAQHEPPPGEVRTVEAVPGGCLAALDGVDRALERSIAFGQSMMDMRHSDGGLHTFEQEGSHYQDSARFHAAMTEAAQRFRDHKAACQG